jgi:hypothetical protein
MLVGDGKRDSVHTKQKVTKCMAVGDRMLCSFGAEYSDMSVECFQGIKTEPLHRVTEKRNLGTPENLIIHISTNKFRTTRNLDSVLVEVCVMVFTANSEIPNLRLVLCGVL